MLQGIMILYKPWIVLITYCNSRSTSLDVVPDCYRHSCIEVLKWFISIHGAPKVIISDNGPSFSEEFKAFTSFRGIIWKHNIQKIPWMEDVLEKKIRFLKQCLRRVLRQARVNYQELLTLWKELENVLSNRPLAVVYYDKLIKFSTPNKLLYGRNINTELLNNWGITKRYIYIKKLLKYLKTRWTNEYLKELREHYYNRKIKYSSHLNVGDVVLLRGNTLKRWDWKTRKIAELILSNDKTTIAAKVNVISHDRIITLKRTINNLFPVESCNQHTIELTFVIEKEWTLHMVSSDTWVLYKSRFFVVYFLAGWNFIEREF